MVRRMALGVKYAMRDNNMKQLQSCINVSMAFSRKMAASALHYAPLPRVLFFITFLHPLSFLTLALINVHINVLDRFEQCWNLIDEVYAELLLLLVYCRSH
jgi:hypothetical protein